MIQLYAFNSNLSCLLDDSNELKVASIVALLGIVITRVKQRSYYIIIYNYIIIIHIIYHLLYSYYMLKYDITQRYLTELCLTVINLHSVQVSWLSYKALSSIHYISWFCVTSVNGLGLSCKQSHSLAMLWKDVHETGSFLYRCSVNLALISAAIILPRLSYKIYWKCVNVCLTHTYNE